MSSTAEIARDLIQDDCELDAELFSVSLWEHELQVGSGRSPATTKEALSSVNPALAVAVKGPLRNGLCWVRLGEDDFSDNPPLQSHKITTYRFCERI